jgi:hypothetical protein
MRLLSQNIAQRANKEDGEVGKFLQARYRAGRLLDETAILACAAYVDLNPIRAAITETIEDSDFTSAQKRAAALRGECSVADDAGPADEINVLKLSGSGGDAASTISERPHHPTTSRQHHADCAKLQ